MTEEVIVEKRRPQVEFEEVQVRSNTISKPARELIVEHYDTVVEPPPTEIIETTVAPPVEVCS